MFGIYPADIAEYQAEKMTADRFVDARTRLKMKRGEFANALGIHRDTARAYEAGERVIPQTVAMAVQCLQNGLPPAT